MSVETENVEQHEEVITPTPLRDEPALITFHPQRVGGKACFGSSRLPIRLLFRDYLSTGESIDAFLKAYPSVSREHVLAVLAKALLLTEGSAVYDVTVKSEATPS